MTFYTNQISVERSAVGMPRAGTGQTSVPLLLAVACWPFIQLGLNFWASVATLAAVLAIVAFALPLARGAARGLVFIIGVVPLMYLCLAAHNTTLPDVLKVSREAVFFTLLLSVLVSTRILPSFGWTKPVLILFAILAVGELALTVIQFVGIPKRVYITLPREFFVQNQSTIPELIDLIYSRIRPSGTFAEPSYLGFASLSIAFAVSPIVSRSPLALVAFVCAIGAGLMSQSAAFVIAAAVTLTYALFASGVIRSTKRSLAVLTIFLFAIASVGLPLVQDRFLSTSGGVDASAYTRIFLPFDILFQYISRYPVGSPYSEMMPTIISLSGTNEFGALPIHNAIFNAFFSYGVIGGIVIVTLLSLAPNNSVRLYIIAASSFNGALFSVDKFAMMSLAIFVFSSTILSNPRIVRTTFATGR